MALKLKKSFLPWPLNTGQREYGHENGTMSKKKLERGRFERLKRGNR